MASSKKTYEERKSELEEQIAKAEKSVKVSEEKVIEFSDLDEDSFVKNQAIAENNKRLKQLNAYRKRLNNLLSTGEGYLKDKKQEMELLKSNKELYKSVGKDKYIQKHLKE